MLRADEPTSAPEHKTSHELEQGRASESLRRAFRDLHGPTLHGFALLLTLGDRRRAAHIAADALRAGEEHLAELRHPERAAAWLRARATAARGRDGRLDAPERLRALVDLGVSPRMLAGLASLNPRERAALVASWVERLDRRDVATITRQDGDRLDGLLRRARRRYLAGYATGPDDGTVPAGTADGPVLNLVRAAASRALP